MSLALVLARLIGVFGALARTRFGLSFFRGSKGNACAPGLGKTDSDGLLGRFGPMFAVAYLVDLLTNEFARLGGGCLARALVLTRFLGCPLVRHHFLHPAQLSCYRCYAARGRASLHS